MRYRKIFSTVAFAIIFAMLVMAVPAIPVLAAESISIDPEEGKVGETVDIDGENFEETVYTGDTITHDSLVDIYFSSDKASRGDDIDSDVDTYAAVKTSVQVDEDGIFSTNFKVPSIMDDGDKEADVTGGDYYIYVTYEDEKNIEDVAEFTVISGKATLTPASGKVGTKVKITGTKFSENEIIYMYFDDDQVDIGNKETDDQGELSLNYTIPNSTGGEHTLTIDVENDAEVKVKFTVEPSAAISPTSGKVGDKAAVRGNGFGGDETVTVFFDAASIAQGQSDDSGNFATTFNIPAVTAGTHVVKMEDESGNEATVEFKISIEFNVSPIAGNVGSRIVVSGAGFAAIRQVTVTYDDKQIASGTADSKGIFSINFQAPAGKGGNHTISVSDGINNMTSPFTMESTPPGIPQPQLPLMSVKAEALTQFDWADVTDPSGVTYTLQVATSEDFSQSSIVLEKTGLTTSAYTLKESEKLPSTEKDAPYYWRVKATDGASNESGWTGLGEFYVGFQMTGLGGAVKYILMIIGGIVLLLLGLWIGRKTSYYA